MDKSQYKLCCKVLERLDKEGVLQHVLLIGSWCMLAYKDYFAEIPYQPAIRTRDIDLLVPLPPKFTRKVDIENLLRDLDFVVSFKGRQGFIQLVHSELMLEFLVPERGRGFDKPYPLPKLGVNAQAIRYLDFLTKKVIKASLENIAIKVPHPACFALHKIMVSVRRSSPSKSENDYRQGVYVLRCLIDNKEQRVVRRVAGKLPRKWQGLIKQAFAGTTDENLVNLIFPEN